MRTVMLCAVLLAAAGLLWGCGRREGESEGAGGEGKATRPKPGRKEGAMELTSPAFDDGGDIPVKYTCDGKDISPPLQIKNVPEGTRGLALVVDDPDAPGGTFDHWLVWNIPPDTVEIPEGKQPAGTAGRNDFGKLTYGGPCPPSGTHTYRFKLFALDSKLDLPRGANKARLQSAMEGHVLAKGVLKGRYSRR